MKSLLKNSMLVSFLFIMLVAPIAFVGAVKYKNQNTEAGMESVLSVTDERSDKTEVPENMPKEIEELIIKLEKQMMEEASQSTPEPTLTQERE